MSDARKVVQSLAVHLNLQSLRQRRHIFELTYGTNDAQVLQRMSMDLQKAIAALNELDKRLQKIGEVVEIESEAMVVLEEQRRGMKRRSDVEVDELEEL